MKTKKRCLSLKTMDNQGFSLIELVISIAILVLIMVPLMNSFYQSMKLNRKAEQIQIQSNLAGSMMEGLQDLDMGQTLNLFRMPPETIIAELQDNLGIPGAEQVRILSFNGTSYDVVDPSNYHTLDGQATYYFAIHNIKQGGFAFDTLIKLDSSTNAYRPAGNTKNNYAMPDAINLDKKANGIYFSRGATDIDNELLDDDTIDEQALKAYLRMGEAYAEQLFYSSTDYLNYLAAHEAWRNDYENAQMQSPPGTVGPEPTLEYNPQIMYPEYVNKDTVRASITKTMVISVDRNKIDYRIDYKRVWPSGCDLDPDLQYTISSTTYTNNIENVYLFYRPSIYRSYRNDEVIIENNSPTPIDHPITFYVAKQVGADGSNKLIIKTASAQNITVHTNLDPLQAQLEIDNILAVNGIRSGVVKTQQRDRIYEATVTVYEHVASPNISDKYKKKLYTLSSTREE